MTESAHHGDRDDTSPDRAERGIDCATHLDRLTSELAGELDPAATAAQISHRVWCEACSLERHDAVAVDELTSRFAAPLPPSGFAARALARHLGSEGKDANTVDCREFRSELEAFRAGDVAVDRTRSLALHVEYCTSCAAELRLSGTIESAVRGIEAPLPPAGFAAAILRRMTSPRERLAPVQSFPLRALPPAVLLCAAAAFLIVALHTWQDASLDSPSLQSNDPRSDLTATNLENGDAPQRWDHAIEQLSLQRERLIRSARLEAVPASIGAFAAPSQRSTPSSRYGGNVWHRALRRAVLETESPQDSAPGPKGH